MENNKSHGNDGITKEFYCTFWNEIKNIFMNSLRESKLLNALSTSQIKAIIRLIEKLYQKLISKTLATRLKTVLPFLISPGQTAYVNGRFLCESGRLKADIIETCDLDQLEGYLVLLNFKKVFDSLNWILSNGLKYY